MPRDRRSFFHRSTKPLTRRTLEAIRDWARLEQTRSELPLSRDGADALGQSAPMAACFQLWSPGSNVRGNSGGIALTGSTLAACHRTNGLSSPDWHRAKGSEPQAQPPDRHSPPQSSRSGQASHQEEMRRSVPNAELGRIGNSMSGWFGAILGR